MIKLVQVDKLSGVEKEIKYNSRVNTGCDAYVCMEVKGVVYKQNIDFEIGRLIFPCALVDAVNNLLDTVYKEEGIYGYI